MVKPIVQATAKRRAGTIRTIDLKLERRHAWSKATNLNYKVEVRNNGTPGRTIFELN